MKALKEKHLAQVADNLSYFNDCKTSFAISECKSWINKIFDDVEALQHRSCEGCKHLLASPRICLKRIQNCDGILPKDFCCNRYEPKEQ